MSRRIVTRRGDSPEPPEHPGQLVERLMLERNLKPKDIAKTGISGSLVHHIIKSLRRISAHTAICLETAFPEIKAEDWLIKQNVYDLYQERLKREE